MLTWYVCETGSTLGFKYESTCLHDNRKRKNWHAEQSPLFALLRPYDSSHSACAPSPRVSCANFTPMRVLASFPCLLCDSFCQLFPSCAPSDLLPPFLRLFVPPIPCCTSLHLIMPSILLLHHSAPPCASLRLLAPPCASSHLLRSAALVTLLI